MTRWLRVLIVALTIVVLLASRVLEAQQAGKLRVGLLCPTQCVPANPAFQPFHEGLRDYGWIHGQNIVLEYRHAFGKAEQLPKLATELVSAKPDVLIAPSPSAARALKDATIPQSLLLRSDQVIE